MIFRGFVFMQNLPPLPDFGLFCRKYRLLCRYANLNAIVSNFAPFYSFVLRTG